MYLKPRTVVLGSCLILTSFLAGTVAGQQSRKNKKEPTPAKPQSIDLTTKDGLVLHCRYYPGLHGEETIPVILLHDLKGKAADMEPLAKTLQQEAYGGLASLIPDLRGHGKSTQLLAPGYRQPQTVSADRMRRDDFQLLLKKDMETMKRFLMLKNNQGELNIDSLCVVGSGMGAVLAAYWAAEDWSWPQLAGHKQGQDVKAVVLISLPNDFKGIPALSVFRHMAYQSELSVMLIYGSKNPKMVSTARRVVAAVEGARRPPGPQRIFDVPLDTSLQGTRMLAEPQLRVASTIATFIHRRVAERQDTFPWRERSHPLGGS